MLTDSDCEWADESRMNGYVLFSVRDKISKAIADPGQYFERYRTADGLVEALDHWQARAAIEAMFQCAASSPSFAQAIEARRAETAKTGSVEDESAVPKECAQKGGA
jgi:hypothetical protein